MTAAKKGDCGKLQECIDRGALLSVVRASQGETAVHLAVTSGVVDAVAGAYVNVVDWRGATLLYYACTHPGQDGVLKNDADKRCEMVAFLVSLGADTMRQSGFSAMRPLEATQSEKAATLILEDPLHKTFVAKINSRDSPREAKKLMDLSWRANTAGWLIQYNRGGMMQNFRLHPLLKPTSPEQVEEIFKNCQCGGGKR